MSATPALSYPRYSRRFSPLMSTGYALRFPKYPTIPHIVVLFYFGLCCCCKIAKDSVSKRYVSIGRVFVAYLCVDCSKVILIP